MEKQPISGADPFANYTDAGNLYLKSPVSEVTWLHMRLKMVLVWLQDSL